MFVRVLIIVAVSIALLALPAGASAAPRAHHPPAWAPCYRPGSPRGAARRRCIVCHVFAQVGECSWAVGIARRESGPGFRTDVCDYMGGDHCGMMQMGGRERRRCGTYDRHDPNWRKFRAFRRDPVAQARAALCLYRIAGRHPWAG